jgi:hypothetical protein
LIGFALGGLIAGEGTFVISPQKRPLADGSTKLRFRFEVGMADRDRPLLEALRSFLGVGSIRTEPPRGTWQPVARYAINSHRAHRAATIPFAETFLLPSAKRSQFEAWRDALDRYEEEHPNKFGKGPSPCSEPGCDRPVRGRGLCRRHYYRVTGY